MAKMNNLLPQNLFSFVWHFYKPYKSMIIIYVFMALMAGAWGPFNSMLIKDMINILSSSKMDDIAFLTWPAMLIVLNFILFDNITWRTIDYINYKFQPVIKNNMTSETFSFIHGASPQFFHDNLSGRISHQINTLVDNIERTVHYVTADFLRGISLLFIAFITMYYVNDVFFYTLALWFIVFSSFSVYISKRLVKLSDIHARAESAISGQLVDSISNASNVRIFSRRDYESSRLEPYLLRDKTTFQSKEMYLLIVRSIQGLMISIMLGVMVYFLIQLYAKELITIGDFALILGLSMEVAHITWYTMRKVNEFHEAFGKCNQSLTSLIVPQDIQDKKDAPDIQHVKGEIIFENVQFHYKHTKLLFNNKSVTIPAGQKVGLVGYSGGGKSTFVNLILRFFDVTDGHIYIDKQDIRDVTQESLRKQIAMIPQDPTLFHRTLMENIRYGLSGATDNDVIIAAKKAHAHQFISKLTDGYASTVGERGVKLSGGQRQRIAIARAILKNAPILILDEATSQLDSVTERDIQTSLWQLMQNKTTLVIAHRLSTLLHMDRILVFEQGKIVEDGTHAELLAHNGLYKTLWDTQVGGFLRDGYQL